MTSSTEHIQQLKVRGTHAITSSAIALKTGKGTIHSGQSTASYNPNIDCLFVKQINHIYLHIYAIKVFSIS